MTAKTKDLAAKPLAEPSIKSPLRIKRLGQSAVVLLVVLLLSGYTLVCRYYPWRDLANQDIPE